MQIKKTVAVAMLVALGFSKAEEWDNDKLSERLLLVPEKVGREDVPDEFDKIYDALAEAEKVELVEDEGKEAVEKPAKKDAKPAKAEKPAKKDAKPAKAKKDDRPYIKPMKDAAKKDAKPAKAEKPAKAAKGPRPLRDGSIAAAVEGAISKEWQDEAAIAKEAKLEVRIARGRLYHAASKGLYERRHSIQYRLAPTKKAE